MKLVWTLAGNEWEAAGPGLTGVRALKRSWHDRCDAPDAGPGLTGVRALKQQRREQARGRGRRAPG